MIIHKIKTQEDIPKKVKSDDIAMFYFMPDRPLNCVNVFVYTKEYGKKNKALAVKSFIDEVISCDSTLPGARRISSDIKKGDLLKFFKESKDLGKPKKPGLFKKAKNFAKASAKHVANGMLEVPEDVYKKRLTACNDCPMLDKVRECLLCGCPVDTKAKWASEQCPADPPKWLKYEQQKVSGISGNAAQPSKKAGCVPCAKKRRRR